MKVLVTGSGGREHALCWKISQSPLLTKLFCAPGNGGTSEVSENVDISAENIPGLLDFCTTKNVDLVIIGQEVSAILGLADRLREKGIAVFGPSARAAELEGSKIFMKNLCAKYKIPTAKFGAFERLDEALSFIKASPRKMVVKADGLAAGKGVIMAETHEAAETAVREMMEGSKFSKAGAKIVIEEWLEGEEISFFVLSDGKTVKALSAAQDHKRAFDGDQGPNTGGMGSYSPVSIFTKDLEARVMDEIIKPTIAAMIQEGHPYTGVLYAGLMLTAEGPKLLEYNVRFGDPECQVLMPRLECDVLDLFYKTALGQLDQGEIRLSNDSALTVVMATQGYPESYEKGSVIRGLQDAMEQATVFHAGTQRRGSDVLANGGRVLNVTATGSNLRIAHEKAYAALRSIDWPEGFFRTDIGWRELKRLKKAA